MFDEEESDTLFENEEMHFRNENGYTSFRRMSSNSNCMFQSKTPLHFQSRRLILDTNVQSSQQHLLFVEFDKRLNLKKSSGCR